MNNNKTKKTQNSKSLRIGGYSTLISLVVIVIAVVVNLIVTQLPSIYTKFDTSDLKLYSISDESAEIIKAVDMDITMYLIAESGSEDTIINELLGRYSSLNSKINVQQVDPILNPSFVSKYTTNQLNANSVIVESERRNIVIDYTEIYVTDYLFNQETGGVDTSSSFAGESKLTGALDYVTSDNIPIMYIVGGHGETELDATIKGYITNDNIDMIDLNLLTTESIPNDANVVLINNPQFDISETEKDTLLSYLGDGGNVIVIMGFTGVEFPNLYAVASHYGIEPQTGLVVEGSSNNYLSYPYWLVPKFGNHEIVDLLPTTNMYLFLPESTGLKIMETPPRGTLSTTPLLFTTASAYLKNGEVSSLEKAADDIEGPFELGVIVSEPSPKGGTTNLIWYTSAFMLDPTADTYVSGGNSTFFLTNLTWLTDKETSVSIASKTMQVQGLMITQGEANVWGAIFTIIIPLAILGIGLFVWIKRRRR